MKKFIASRDFEYHGEAYTIGSMVELEDHVADKLCNRGYGSKRDERRIEEKEVKEEKRESKKFKYKKPKKNRE